MPHTYTLDGTVLQRRTETRDLGLLLGAKLTFASHIDCTTGRCNRMLGLVIRSMQLSRRHSRARLDHGAMLCTYYAHVRSILEYGCVVWAGAAVTHLKRMEKVQHRFLVWLARNSDRPSNSTDYCTLLSHFDVRSMKSRLAQYDLMFLFHVYRARIDSPVLLGSFGLAVPARSTRSYVLWNVPRGRVNTVQRNVFTRTPSLCNSFLAADSSVDMFMSTERSFKSRAIGFTRTLGSYL